MNTAQVHRILCTEHDILSFCHKKISSINLKDYRFDFYVLKLLVIMVSVHDK